MRYFERSFGDAVPLTSQVLLEPLGNSVFLGELEVGVTVMGDSAIIGLDVIHLEV